MPSDPLFGSNLQLLEELLDLLDRRGLHPGRIRVGDIEIDGLSGPPSTIQTLSPSRDETVPVDPGVRVTVPIVQGGLYGSPSLWPTREPPKFPSPPSPGKVGT